MEVTKQKMRCAAAEDPSYPCKHHGEGQVSPLPGEEVIVACWGASLPTLPAGQTPGGAGCGGPPGRVEGGDGGTPRAVANLGAPRAGQRAGQRVWPGLRSQLPCHYAPA